MTVRQEYLEQLFGCCVGDTILINGSIRHRISPRLATVEQIDGSGMSVSGPDRGTCCRIAIGDYQTGDIADLSRALTAMLGQGASA